MLFQAALVSSFSLLFSSPFREYTALQVFILLLKDIGLLETLLL